ncbi:FHA domain-containing protein [Gemmata sp.]|uniref:FHA domain-containing protein n=1 Tax=Gemmata sp. TaxID=1914242 RepID=UPI003F72FD77
MKVSLYVASGTHQGKVIPVTTQEFAIGRDRACHLRPASQAISKRHCGLVVRDGLVYLTDFGSTNGTLVNGVMVRSEEVEVPPGSTLTIGPLDFILRVDAEDEAGAPVPISGTGTEAEQYVSAVADARSVENTAAMLLALDDEGGVRDGSTVTELPLQSAAETRVGDALPPAAKPDDKKKATSREEMTAAAGAILRKLMRRPK